MVGPPPRSEAPDEPASEGEAPWWSEAQKAVDRATPQKSEDEELQILSRRLWKSDELIKQLKHIVKAQHGKIEELRERLEFDPSGHVKALMASQDLNNHAKVKEAYEDMKTQLNKAKHEASKFKAENDNLKRVNRRLKSMLGQSPLYHDTASPLLSSTEMPSIFKSRGADALIDLSSTGSLIRELASREHDSSTQRSLHSAPLMGSPDDSARRVLHSAPSMVSPDETPARRALQSSAGKPSHDHARRSVHGGLPVFSKISRLITAVPMFWRDLEAPRAVLVSLMDISGRLLSDGTSLSFTVYMLDPWLRAVCTDNRKASPTLYHLGHGKTTVQVLQLDGKKSDAPCFADLGALPHRTRTNMAVEVKMPSSHRRLAVLQVVVNEEMAKDKKATGRKSLVSRGMLPSRSLVDHELEEFDVPEPTGFSDSQLMCLQLVSSIAGGTLEQQERLARESRNLIAVKNCVDIAVVVNKAGSLRDFEQRLKHQFAAFFHVRTVRVLFFNAPANTLLISSAQVRGRSAIAIRIDKGIVGLCARRQQLVHVPNVAHHPYVDAVADGLLRGGKPHVSNVSMLCGPMLVDHEDGSRLVGVVQLIERTKKQGSEDGDGVDFTPEEQSNFEHLLQICSHVVCKAIRVQELSAEVGGNPSSLDRILAS